MNISTSFVVIDDDEFNNKICSVTLKKLADTADVKTFLSPFEGFDYISTEYDQPGKNCVLFLDINMPGMDGWQFLEKYEGVSDMVKSRVKIYILSSSIDKKDTERAQQNKHVVNYLVKPLTKETIRLITHMQNKERV